MDRFPYLKKRLSQPSAWAKNEHGHAGGMVERNSG
jgi:hypothetical protein